MKAPGTGEFIAQMASNPENISIWWRHHVKMVLRQYLRLMGYSSMGKLFVKKQTLLSLQRGLSHFCPTYSHTTPYSLPVPTLNKVLSVSSSYYTHFLSYTGSQYIGCLHYSPTYRQHKIFSRAGWCSTGYRPVETYMLLYTPVMNF